MITVAFVLALAAFLCILASTSTPPRIPLWVGCLLLSLAILVQTIPLR
jgi:hypothetical protein